MITGNEYRKVRKQLGMTQKQLADAVGRHATIISRRERGEKPVTREAELAIRFLAVRKAAG